MAEVKRKKIVSVSIHVKNVVKCGNSFFHCKILNHDSHLEMSLSNCIHSQEWTGLVYWVCSWWPVHFWAGVSIEGPLRTSCTTAHSFIQLSLLTLHHTFAVHALWRREFSVEKVLKRWSWKAMTEIEIETKSRWSKMCPINQHVSSRACCCTVNSSASNN